MRKCLLLFVFIALSASPSHARTYPLMGEVIGMDTYYTVGEGDTLYSVARRYDIGIVELLVANPGVDPWQPKAGTHLKIIGTHVLPMGARKGIVINLSELRLFYYHTDGTVMSFPIGIGREGWRTPVGKTRIIRKRENPSWVPPDSIREENPDLPKVFPPGPDNPLGKYALDLPFHGIRIHGTNRPYGVGRRSSHGCIRLYPEDIALLFRLVEVGTPVTIVDQEFKLGWRYNELYLEVTPTQQQADVIADYKEPLPISIPDIYDAINNASRGAEVSWYEVEHAIKRRDGVPVRIAERQALTPAAPAELKDIPLR